MLYIWLLLGEDISWLECRWTWQYHDDRHDILEISNYRSSIKEATKNHERLQIRHINERPSFLNADKKSILGN